MMLSGNMHQKNVQTYVFSNLIFPVLKTLYENVSRNDNPILIALEMGYIKYNYYQRTEWHWREELNFPLTQPT